MKQIINQDYCRGLHVGDIIWKVDEIDERNVLEYSAVDLMTKLQGKERACFEVLRLSPDMHKLKQAIEQGDIDCIDQILDKKEIHIDTCFFESSKNYMNSQLLALMVASEEGQLDAAVHLIRKWEAEVNLKNEDGLTALMIASLSGQCAIVKLLLENKADVNQQNINGWSALMLACREGHLKIVEMLVEYGTNIDLHNDKGWSALMVACENSQLQIVELLLKERAILKLKKEDMDNDMGFSLKIASQQGNFEVVKLLIDEGADVNFQNAKGWSSLMIASKEGHLEVVKLLLENSAKVNLQNDKGWSALMTACEMGHITVVKLLLENGANVDIQSSKGVSARSLGMINQRKFIKYINSKEVSNFKPILAMLLTDLFLKAEASDGVLKQLFQSEG